MAEDADSRLCWQLTASLERLRARVLRDTQSPRARQAAVGAGQAAGVAAPPELDDALPAFRPGADQDDLPVSATAVATIAMRTSGHRLIPRDLGMSGNSGFLTPRFPGGIWAGREVSQPGLRPEPPSASPPRHQPAYYSPQWMAEELYPQLR
eukprot:TRINITY_DN17541_c0_g1_i1.p1 TRINITY_DN17541_c0_g1~~TRINITY_DN17541_c0_g1_i1.p1  ORF type:complete len:152 (+),score=20.66 TRINITY_DN17541_c0_g1_i1:47-502(+)